MRITVFLFLLYVHFLVLVPTCWYSVYSLGSLQASPRVLLCMIKHCHACGCYAHNVCRQNEIEIAIIILPTKHTLCTFGMKLHVKKIQCQVSNLCGCTRSLRSNITICETSQVCYEFLCASVSAVSPSLQVQHVKFSFINLQHC